MATVKNLSLSQIKKQDAQKFKDKKQVLFNDGQSKVDVDMLFRPSKRKEVVAELLRLLQDKVRKQESVNEDSVLAVIFSLIIKHFTSIDIKGVKTFDDYVEMYKILDDNDYLSPILQAFNSKELQEMLNEAEKVLDNWTLELNKILDGLRQDEKEIGSNGKSDVEES